MVLHGRTDAQDGALVPLPVESIHFIRAVGPHIRHEPGGHIVPSAGVVHGGGGRVPRPMAKRDVRHGAGSLCEVAGPRRKHPSYADSQGELLPCDKPRDPEAQFSGRRLLRLFAGPQHSSYRRQSLTTCILRLQGLWCPDLLRFSLKI